MITFVTNEDQMSLAIKYLKGKKILGVDTETTGLNPWKNKMLLLQIGDVEQQFVFDVSKVDLSPLFPILQSNSILKIGVNLRFDYKFIVNTFGIRLENIYDCMIVDKCINLGKDYSFSMAEMAKRYLQLDLNSRQLSLFDVTVYKSLRNEFSESTGDFTEEQIKYAAQDVVIPFLLKDCLDPIVKQERLTNLIKLENEVQLCLADMELNGMYLNSERWMEVYHDNLALLEQKKERLDKYLKTVEWEEVNWNSHKQVVELFKFLGIPVQIIDTEKSTPDEVVYKDSVRATLLEKYKKDFEILPLYLDYKDLFKQISTYGEKFLKNINPVTGRVHSNYFEMVNTGRMSSSKPNLQNIPRSSRYRSCFQSQHEDTILLVADYSNQEARILADISGDKKLIQLFNEGDGDMHSLTASLLFNVPVNRNENRHLRSIGKTINFAILYGASAFKLAKDFSITEQEAQSFIDRFYKAYPSLKPYFKKVQQDTFEKGYVLIDSKIHRRSHQPKWELYKEYKELTTRYSRYGWIVPRVWWSKMYRLKGQMERNSQNYPIQGQAASITKLALVYLRRYIRENDLWNDFKICNVVHDEIITEVNRSHADLCFSILQTCMQDAGKVFCKKIEISAEPVLTEYWTH